MPTSVLQRSALSRAVCIFRQEFQSKKDVLDFECVSFFAVVVVVVVVGLIILCERAIASKVSKTYAPKQLEQEDKLLAIHTQTTTNLTYQL